MKTCAEGWWMVQTMAVLSCAISTMQSTTTDAAWASSPEVGSSRKSTFGDTTSSIAIDSRFRCSRLMPAPGSPTSARCSASRSSSDSSARRAAMRALEKCRRL